MMPVTTKYFIPLSYDLFTRIYVKPDNDSHDYLVDSCRRLIICKLIFLIVFKLTKVITKILTWLILLLLFFTILASFTLILAEDLN